MTRKKKHRHAAQQKTEGKKRADSPMSEQCSDDGGVPQADDTFVFQMSCRPNGSKLNKPTDFFTMFFAVCAKDSDKKISFEKMQFLKDDIFLFQSSKKHRRAVQELQSRGEREYGAKTIKVLSIQNMRPNPDSKTSTVEESVCVDGRVVRVVGDISSVGMDKLRSYVESEESGGGMIEVDDLKADPATITLWKREAAYGLVDRGVHTINGISVSFILNHPEPEYPSSGLQNDLESGCTVEIGGSIQDIWSDVLVTYFQNQNTSGGGKIREHNLDKSPPTVTFVEREAAKRVVEKRTHVVDGKVITVWFPGSSSQEPDEKKEVAERVVRKGKHCIDNKEFFVEFPKAAAETRNAEETNAAEISNEKDVEIHGELDKIGQDTLLMYLESKRRSGGGEIEKHDFNCSPATVTFCSAEVAERVVRKGKHCIDNKEFFVEFPKAAAETRNAEETNAAEISNEKDVEIHGELDKIGQDTLLMYLESKRRSGGGEIEKHDFNCSPATVTFCSAEVAERVVRKGKHCIDNKEFFVEFPKAAAENRNAEETNAAEINNEKDVEIHGELDKIGQDTLLMYLENKRRSGGGEIEKHDFDCSPATVTFCSAEVAERVVRKGKHCIDNKEFFVEFPKAAAETRNAEETNAAEISNEKDVEIHGELDKIGQDTLLMYLENKRRSGGGEIEKHDFNCSPATATFCSAEDAERVVRKGKHCIDNKEFFVEFPKAAAENRNAEETNAAEISNEKDVEIHGELDKIGQDTLLMYLESKRRSGGGEIERHNFNCSPATATFCSAEDAERVVRKGKHCIDNKEFFVEFPKAAAETRNAEETNAAEINNEKDVEIHGELDKIGQDALLMYLESKRRSGGGEIEKHNFNCSPATATFCSAEAAKRVVSKPEHIVDNNVFKVVRHAPKSPAQFLPNTILISNLHKETHFDSLKLYIDKLCGAEPADVLYSHDKTAAMATLPEEIGKNYY
eukprot:gene280-9930_t